jgi:MFS family permease
MASTEYATSAPSDAIPTRTRYRVVAFCVALAGVTYLDRNCISLLAPLIQEDLGLSRIQMGWVFTIFAISYAAFEVPSAWWGQKVGTRRVLTRIVAWWSAFTIATGAAFNYPSMLITRFLFGAGEAGAWPNAARTFSLWIPGRERGRVQGIFSPVPSWSAG